MADENNPSNLGRLTYAISYLISIGIVSYGFYWLYQQLEKVSIWVNYIKLPFFIILGIGFVGLFALYGMVGLALYKNAKEMNKKYARKEEEE